MSKTSWLLSSTALIGLATAPAAHSADLVDPAPAPEPVLIDEARFEAVSGVNAKIDFRGGVDNDVEFFAGVGSLALPLGESFGFQADGMIGALDGDVMGGGAAHLFWRDPRLFLLGLYGEVSHSEAGAAGTLGRGAFEAEGYFDRVTVTALLGGQAGDLGEGFFSKETVSFYPTDDLRLYGAHKYLPDGDGHSGAIGAEFLTPLAGHGLALFGEGRLDEDGDWGAQGGVRMYFGPSRTLIQRHREDDPPDHFDLFVQAATHAVDNPPDDPVIFE